MLCYDLYDKTVNERKIMQSSLKNAFLAKIFHIIGTLFLYRPTKHGLACEFSMLDLLHASWAYLSNQEKIDTECCCQPCQGT